MRSTSSCVTCPHGDQGICGALLPRRSEKSDVHQPPGWQRHRTGRPGELVVTPNQVFDEAFVLCRGWAFRFFQLADGRRQILKFLLPGDLFSVASVFAEQCHCSVKALTAIQFSGFKRADIHARCAGSPDFSTALADLCIAEARNTDELATALGQTSAEERVAYLFMHLTQRIAAQNVIRDNCYPFPLRQQHIADALGLTSVHVSRVIGLLRDRGIVQLSNGVLQVFNPAELKRLGSMR